MKYLFLLLISFPVFACMNQLPLSEVEKAVALQPNAGSKSCNDIPEEQCLCYDGIDWEASVLIDEVDDTTGIYTGKKLLRHSPVKKLEKEAKEKADKEAEVEAHNKKKVICEEVQSVKKSDLTSNAKTVDFIFKFMECSKP